ncbi:MAG: VOC family protein [Planctomycetota bacterium]
MSKVGTVGWFDLTVPEAGKVRDFYCAVAGWTAQEHDMGAYADYEMFTPDGERVAGVCHRRGPNKDVPPQWLIYIAVADVNASLDACIANGGQVLSPAKEMGSYGRIAIVKDPAGAVAALWEQAGA